MIKPFEIADERVAALVTKKLTQSFDLLGECIVQVNANASAQDAEIAREGIGDAFYAIVFKLLEPIYEQYPQSSRMGGMRSHPKSRHDPGHQR